MHVVDRELAEFDIEPKGFGGETRLGKVTVVEIDSEHAICTTPFHLDTVEPGITTNIKYCFAAQILRDIAPKSLPFYAWIVAQKMIGRSLHTAKVNIVEPIAQCADALLQLLARSSLDFCEICAHATTCSARSPTARLSKFIASR